MNLINYHSQCAMLLYTILQRLDFYLFFYPIEDATQREKNTTFKNMLFINRAVERCVITMTVNDEIHFISLGYIFVVYSINRTIFC